MCGRYFIDVDEKELKEVFVNIKDNFDDVFKTGEIFPTNKVPIMTKEGIILAKWGIPKWDKGVIINARVEGLKDRKSFRHLVYSGRCIIPASAYYEWDKDTKKKYKFEHKDTILYMAGLYELITEKSQQLSLLESKEESYYAFAVITKDANDSVSPIHNRMPLIFHRDEMDLWLQGYEMDFLVSNNNYNLNYAVSN